MEEKFVKKNPFEKTESREGVKPKRKEPIPEPVAPPKAEEPKPEKPVADKPEVVTDLLSGIVQTKAKKNISFYLEDDIVTALDKLAKQNKTTRSLLVNTLLRNLLLNK